MFDIGWSELLVIMVVLLVVVGPKDLPRIVRTFGQWSGKARGYARDFQRTIEEAADAGELAAVRKEIELANRELAEVTRTPIDLNGKIDLDETAKKDPQAAQFSSGAGLRAGATDPAAAPAAVQAQSSPPAAPANEPPARTA